MSFKTSLRASAAAIALLASAPFAVVPFAAEAATVIGRVSDTAGVSSLSGARVEIVELNRRTSTSQNGSYRFADVEPGTYTLRITYINAEVLEQQLVVSGDGITTADASLGTAIEEVIVIGQIANVSSSLSRQRASDTVKSILTRDSIGQFPDQNVAESIRRVTGVNVLNDQGEGRFIAVRGLDPNLNSASINGARVPSPESDVRSVALDVIPSELIESIEITKTLTPDMDADTIGASIEINTTSAFDREGTFFGGTLEGSYNDLNEKVSPKGGVDFSHAFSEKFGVSGGLSYYRRSFSTDNIEAEGWDTTDDGVTFADEIQYRDYDVRRSRFGSSLSLDLRPSENTELYARGLFSRFADQEFRGRLTFKLDEEPSSGSATTATFLSDDGEIEIERDIKDRFEVQKIYSLVTGGETFKDAWTFEYSGSYSKASELENGSLDPTTYVAAFEDPGQLGVMFDYSDYKRPGFNIIAGQSAFADPNTYEFDEIERTILSDATDEEWGAKLDLTRQFVLTDGAVFDVKFGGKARLRQKQYDFNVEFLSDGPLEDTTLAQFATSGTYGLANIAPQVDPLAVRELVNGNLSAFDNDDIDGVFDSATADYNVDEDIYAGYIMGRYDNGSLKAIGGVRVEHTKDDINGNLVELVEEGGTRNGVTLDDDTVFVTPNAFTNSYTNWLPSVNLTYETENDVLLRAGIYRSVVRPNIGQIAPRFVIEENDDGEREGEFGDPNLRPYKAWNGDVSVEWYFNNAGVLQGGLFYKDIKDFIVSTEVDNLTFNGIFADEAIIPVNGESAEVFGAEFGYQQVMDFLPGPWDGVLIGFNYTFTDSEGTVDGRTISLPASSKHTFNTTLGYEKGPLSLRLAGAYRSNYLDELSGGPDEDRFVKSHFQLDASAKYRVTDQFQIFAELINITDEPFVAYQRGPVSDRLLQYEEYSFTAKAGVRFTY